MKVSGKNLSLLTEISTTYADISCERFDSETCDEIGNLGVRKCALLQ